MVSFGSPTRRFTKFFVGSSGYWKTTTSPTFVPRQAPDGPAARYAGEDPGGHDGYVVQPVFNDDGFRVELFDAADVGAGPIAVAKPAGGRCAPSVCLSAAITTAKVPVRQQRTCPASIARPPSL